MKTIKYIVFLNCLLLLCCVTSCSDFLNVDSKDTQTTPAFYKTEDQIHQALNGVYNGLLPFANDMLHMSECRSDNIYVQLQTNGQRDYSDIGTFRINIVNNGTVDGTWKHCYTLIANANMLLSKIDDVSFAHEKVKIQYKAEAHFLRALAYFDLVRYFGRIPLLLEPKTKEEALEIRQSEAKEIYEQAIIPDLEYAIQNLPLEPLNYQNGKTEGKANLIAAKALLGRVYLTMAGFPLNEVSKKDLAKELFEEVIKYAEDSGKYWAKDADDWKRIWVSDNDNKYHIFEIQYEKGGLGIGNTMVFNSCPLLYSAYTEVRIFGNQIFVERSLGDEFKKTYNDKMDERCLATIDTTKFVNTDGATPVKYTDDDFYIKFLEHKMKRTSLGYSDIDKSIVNNDDWPINYPLIRLEDVMLMYAEIVGPTPKGLEMVNKIRTRAGMDAITAASDEDFQQFVERERRLELAFEGVRWHDLVRHNNLQAIRDMFHRYAINNDGSINQTIESYVQNVKEGMHLYPIPESQIKVKNGLYEQNEAYK